MRRFFLIVLASMVLFSGCSIFNIKNDRNQLEAPPEDILYLGGAPILNKFSADGGPSSENVNGEIIIFVPFQLVTEGFNGVVLGTKADGTQENLRSTDDFKPGTYLTITKEEYAPYTRLIMMLDYSWHGTLLSMRTIDLYTLEEQSSIIQEFGKNN